MAGGKGKAKKDGQRELEEAQELIFNAATGTEAAPLQHELINQVARTLWVPEGLSEDQTIEQLKSAIAMMEGIKPEGEIEGLLAAQMVATHSAAMECLRRAMLQGQTFAGRDQNLKHAAKLLTIYTRQVEVLDKRRGKGQQKVTVEYVNVEAGGQAVVGNIESGGAAKRRRHKSPSGPKSIAHEPGVTVNDSIKTRDTTLREEGSD